METDINEKVWLVKSSGRLIGPISLSDVVIHLQQQSLSVIDEIRSPWERWIFIREHPTVMAIFKEMSGDVTNDSLTESTHTLEHTKTKTEITEDIVEAQELKVTEEETKATYATYQKIISAKEKQIQSGPNSESFSKNNEATIDTKIT